MPRKLPIICKPCGLARQHDVSTLAGMTSIECACGSVRVFDEQDLRMFERLLDEERVTDMITEGLKPTKHAGFWVARD